MLKLNLKHRSIKRTISAFLFLLAFGILSSGSVRAQSTTIVISQVYGGGGGTSTATPAPYLYSQDYVELFNLGSTAQNIGGWSVQYMSTAQTSASATNVVSIPSGTMLAAGQHFLIAGPTGSSTATFTGPALPVTADVTAAVGSFSMAGGGGKVFLVNDSTPLANSCVGSDIVDYVGQGPNASCYEGSGPAPVPTALSADVRTNQCTDTNVNSADFSVSTSAVPRNSASTVTTCGAPTTNPPAVSAVTFTPSSVAAGGITLLTAKVTKGTNTVSTVTADTSAIGGSTNQVLYDDGTNHDATAGDGIYSGQITVAGAANTYPVTVTATDSSSLTGTASGSLTVTAPTGNTNPALSSGTATPTPVTSGSSTLLTIKLTPGANPTATTNTVTADLSAFASGSATQPLYDDQTHGDATPNDGIYSYTLAVPSAQTAKAYTINVTASDSSARTGTGTITLTVQAPIAAAASVALHASTSSAVLGSSVTITAVVSGNKGSTPTGTVSFSDGSTLLGNGTSSGNGTYTYTSTAFALGSHSITAAYSGDSIYPSYTVPSSGAATFTVTAVPVPDFAFSLGNLSLIATTHSKVQVTTVNVSMTNGFSSPVTFACSGLPAGTRCSFSPTTLTASGSSTLTVGIDDAALHLHDSPFSKRGSETAIAFLLLGLPLAFRRKRFAGTLMAALLLGVIALGVSGCGADNATPNGTSSVTVTATGGNITHTATLSLNVQ